MISPGDAASRMISEGDEVKVYNRTGGFHGVAHVTADVPAGLVVGYLSATGEGLTRKVPSTASRPHALAAWVIVRRSRTIWCRWNY